MLGHIRAQIRILVADRFEVMTRRQLTTGSQTAPPLARAVALDLVRKRLNVQAVGRSSIVDIGFRANDPALAADVADAIVRTCIENNRADRVKLVSRFFERVDYGGDQVDFSSTS